MTERRRWIISLALLVISVASIVAAPCSSDGPRALVVNDSKSAMALAAAVNCSSGVFNVEWKGKIVVEDEIYVAGGTSLYVAGSGLEAEMAGG